MITKGMLAAAMLTGSLPAAAAVVLKTDRNGLLLGATGVKIGTSTYNVDFLDGTCASVYGSCTRDKFDFKTAADATAAASAVLNQVLTGSYRTYDPGNIKGCASATCDIFIAYGLYDADYAEVAVAANRGTNRQFTGMAYLSLADSTVSNSALTIAKFTLQTIPAVPEPATWAMMIVGFGMVAGVSRYRRRSTDIVYA